MALLFVAIGYFGKAPHNSAAKRSGTSQVIPAGSRVTLTAQPAGNASVAVPLVQDDHTIHRSGAPPVSAGLFAPVPVNPDHPRVTFSLLDSDFIVTSQALAYADVGDEEAVAIQDAVRAMRADLEKAIKAAIKVDPLRNDEASGTFAFRIPPFQEEGRRIRADFARTLIARVVEDRADRLLESFNWHDFSGACGEVETLVTFQELPTGRGSYMRAEWEQR